MAVYRFQRVAYRAIKTDRCSRCGKKHRRVRIFEMTINPYNTNAEGQMKTEAEVRADLRVVVDAWKREPIEPCQPREATDHE